MTALGASRKRLRRNVASILGRFGERLEFRRYDIVPNWDQGSQERSLGATVYANATRTSQVVRRREGEGGDRVVREIRQVLTAEYEPFESHGGLDDRWVVVVDGSERALAEVVSADGLDYEAQIVE